ncbi:MAG: ATPase, partial [Bacteroidetes bacterium]|nr:ATPase [Fibrella sp.]
MMILIADSGSTKTAWCLVQNEQIVASVHTTGLNPYYADTPAIVAGLREQLIPALSAQTPD